jgi:D-glycero-D-manno-heptose 1,7-bisphosphate phosphatase
VTTHTGGGVVVDSTVTPSTTVVLQGRPDEELWPQVRSILGPGGVDGLVRAVVVVRRRRSAGPVLCGQRWPHGLARRLVLAEPEVLDDLGSWLEGRGTPGGPLRAALFDRDGTIVEDVPYNDDPARVRPVPGAAAALALLREHGMPVGIVSNQSGVGRGLVRPSALAAVERRVDAVLGPFAVILHCPHVAEDRCGCRKPEPGLVQRGAAELGVPTEACAVVGDIGTDVDAALAAGAWPVLVPTAVTRDREIDSAPLVVGSIRLAAEIVASRSAGARP